MTIDQQVEEILAKQQQKEQYQTINEPRRDANEELLDYSEQILNKYLKPDIESKQTVKAHVTLKKAENLQEDEMLDTEYGNFDV